MMCDKTLWYGAHANAVDAKSGEHLQFWDRWHMLCWPQVGIRDFLENPNTRFRVWQKGCLQATNQHGSLASDYQIARFRYLRHFRSLVHRWWWGHPPSMCPLYPPGFRHSDLLIFQAFSRSRCPFDCLWSSGNHQGIQTYTLGRSSNPFFVYFVHKSVREVVKKSLYFTVWLNGGTALKRA